jgi:hypothetical protein
MHAEPLPAFPPPAREKTSSQAALQAEIRAMQLALMQQIVGDPAGPAAMALPEALLAQLAGSSPASLHLLRELRQVAAARQAGGPGEQLHWILL